MEEFESDDNSSETAPPTRQRVAARAIILASIAYRGILEADAQNPDALILWHKIEDWLRTLPLQQEVEPEEQTILDTPFGQLPSQPAINASWRTEGAAVLAWSLNCYKLPAHDDNSNIDDILDGLGFFQPPADTVLHHGRLRTPAELDRYASVALTIHWRLREFGLSPKAIDFPDFVRRAQWGPLSLDGVSLKNQDLSIRGDSIFEADEQAVYFAQSIARERHQAINWLMGWDEVYSEVDTGT